MRDGSDAISDWPILNALINAVNGATWVSFHHGGGVGIGFSQHAGQVIVADGTPAAARRLQRVLTSDPGMGVARHVDAGYPEAEAFARKSGVRIPHAKRIGPGARQSILLVSFFHLVGSNRWPGFWLVSEPVADGQCFSRRPAQRLPDRLCADAGRSMGCREELSKASQRLEFLQGETPTRLAQIAVIKAGELGYDRRDLGLWRGWLRPRRLRRANLHLPQG